VLEKLQPLSETGLLLSATPALFNTVLWLTRTVDGKYSTMQQTPGLLLPWLYSAVCFLLMKLVASIVMIARASEYAKALSMDISEGDGKTMSITVNSASIATQGVLNLFGVALGIYFFIVIFSFYTELRNGVRSIYPVVGGQPGPAPGVVYPPGTTVIMGYNNAQGEGHVIAQQASYYQQQLEGVSVVQGSARKDVPPSYEKATSASASQY
jgi:hypothetical protein